MAKENVANVQTLVVVRRGDIGRAAATTLKKRDRYNFGRVVSKPDCHNNFCGCRVDRDGS